MYCSRWRPVLLMWTVALTPLAFAVPPALAQSATAMITHINPTSGVAGTLVAVDGTGCITPIGQPASTAELFVRGPGPSTDRVAPLSTGLGQMQYAVGLAGGGFLGLVPIPPTRQPEPPTG